MAASHVHSDGERAREVTQAIVETHGDFSVQEIVLAAEAGSAIAVPADDAPVEEGEVVGHEPVN